MREETKSITPKELNELLNDCNPNDVLIDVRTPAEYKDGHIEKAENSPLSEIENAAKQLKRASTVYVSCGTGARSKQACDALISKGVNVVNVQGGLTAWMNDGFGVVQTGR